MMKNASEVRRLAPWITVVLISFNAGWIASNIFDSNFTQVYQCLQYPQPSANQDSSLHDMNAQIPKEAMTKARSSPVLNKDIKTKAAEIKTATTVERTTSTRTSVAPATTTTSKKPTTIAKKTSEKAKQTTTRDIRQHKENFDLMDYVNAPVPADPADENFECLTGISDIGSKRLNFPLCIFDPKIDIYVSGAIKKGGGRVWEMDNVRRIMDQLGEPRPGVGLIDIGANLGVFTLTAAKAGHPVVAVEPMPAALRRLRKSISLGKLDKKVNVVQAALSNDTGELFLNIDKKNKGGSFLVPRETCNKNQLTHKCDINHPIPLVFMDDLLDVISFDTAVMKIDCEGFEYRAFKRSEKLLEKVNIIYIMMEFLHYTSWWKSPKKKREIDRFLSYLIDKGYTPHTVSGVPLNANIWGTWPTDITWTKS